MSRSPRFLLLAILGTTLSCGGDPKDSSATGGANAGGANAGGIGGSSGGGSSSGGGATGVGAASSVTATCDANQAKLAYDGAAEQSYELKGWPSLSSEDMGKASRISGRFGLGQYEILFEPELDINVHTLPGAVLDKQAWPIRSALFADAREQRLGPIRCVAPGSGSTLARKDDQLLLDLQHVDVIQACADHPVDGQIHLCLGFDVCDGFDGGSVDGTPWAMQTKSWAGATGTWQVDFKDGSYMRARTTGSTMGPAYWALFVTSVTSPHGGQVYCASSGAIEEASGDGHTVMHWGDLGAITCEPGAGSAEGCLKGK